MDSCSGGRLPEAELREVAEVNRAGLPETRPVPDWRKKLLDERLAESEGEPGKDWEDFRAEAWRSVR